MSGHARTRRTRIGYWPTSAIVRLVGIVVASSLCVQLPGPAAAHEEDAPSTGALSVIHPLTLQLLRLHEALDRAPAAQRAEILNQLTQTALERRNTLLALMEEHPEVVLEVALPEAVRNSFPENLRDGVEQHTSLKGSLTVTIASDLDLQIATGLYTLTTNAGEHITLHFVDGKGPDLPTDSQIAVHGVRLADQMALLSADSGSVETITAATLVPSTIKNIAVLLFNFQNNAVQPYTPATAKAVTFTDTNGVNAFYQAVSFGKWAIQGKLNVDGDVYGWYTIPYDNTTCDTSTWASAARTAAAADGFNITGYTQVVYAFPNTGSCAWWGLGTIGGSPGSSWVNGSYQTRVAGHELGHNFTMHHGNSYACTDSSGQHVAISATCISNEYGDPFDIMGSSTNHPNNYHKGQLGVFDPVNTQDITVSGTYTIAPLEWASGGAQVLRIPRDVTSGGSVLKYYYLEFRQPYGVFDAFSSTAPVVNGVSIRLAPPYTTITQSQLIDATPATSSFSDAALAVGQTFYDPIKGITATTRSVSATGAAVDIAFVPPVCTPSNPSLSVSPSSQWGFPGQTLPYTLTLTNNNNSCPAATFNVAPTLPAGWSQSPASFSLNAASGASVNQAISVTAPTDAAVGFYTLTETATNAADAHYAASASATYNVLTPDTTPPTVTITSPAAGALLPRKGTAKIAATASDASGISRIEVFIDQKSVKVCSNTSSCSMNWSVNNVAAGSHSITVTATDKGGPTPNMASGSITVVKP